MRKMWTKLFTTAALAFMLCLTGMVMSGEAQAQRFVDNMNGTVTDTHTLLLWTKNANPFGRVNWHDAKSRCSSFVISGIGGWRLPYRHELEELYHALKGEQHPFTSVQSSHYWSDTPHSDPDSAWVLDMSNGVKIWYNKYITFHVWPVRVK